MFSLEANSLMAEEYNNVVGNFKAIMNTEGDQCVPLDLDAVTRLGHAYEDLLVEKLEQIVDLDGVFIGPADRERVTALFTTRDQVLEEIDVICSDVGEIIDNVLLRNAIGDRERSLIYNFKGDFLRKKWAINPDDIMSCEEATKAYFNALTICKWNFEPTDMHLLQTALSYSMHLNKANKFDEAIATLTGVINNAQETLYNNGDTEIAEQNCVKSILENLKNILSFSRVNSDLLLGKLIEQMESESNRHGGREFGDEEESWRDEEGKMWDDGAEEESSSDEEFRNDIEEQLHHEEEWWNDTEEEPWSDEEEKMWDDDVEEKSWNNDEEFRDDIEEQ